MTNNIEQIEDLLDGLIFESWYCGREKLSRRKTKNDEDVISSKKNVIDIVKSMQSQIEALTKEADADESRESESL